MRERGSGTIVNVTSSVGIAPMPLVAVYTASKYAIEGFSESVAYELGTFGVRVKIVEPGLAPSTSFGANSGGSRDDLMSAAYSAYAGQSLKSMQDYPTYYDPDISIRSSKFITFMTLSISLMSTLSTLLKSSSKLHSLVLR